MLVLPAKGCPSPCKILLTTSELIQRAAPARCHGQLSALRLPDLLLLIQTFQDVVIETLAWPALYRLQTLRAVLQHFNPCHVYDCNIIISSVQERELS